MELPDPPYCLYSVSIEKHDGLYHLEVPERELEQGNIQTGETYRVAMLPSSSAGDSTDSTTTSQDQQQSPESPVEEGEQRRVEIEDIGEQGDGIARVERGFVVIVPDTEKGERVAIKITDVRDRVAFGEVVERICYDE
jgi:predicted RNA-binding protein with TRAM domain